MLAAEQTLTFPSLYFSIVTQRNFLQDISEITITTSQY